MRKFRNGETVYWFDYSAKKIHCNKIQEKAKYSSCCYSLVDEHGAFHANTLFRSKKQLLKHVIKSAKEEIKKYQWHLDYEQRLLKTATELLNNETKGKKK